MLIKSSQPYKFYYLSVLPVSTCAGISRQLHPLKVKDLMYGKIVGIKYNKAVYTAALVVCWWAVAV